MCQLFSKERKTVLVLRKVTCFLLTISTIFLVSSYLSAMLCMHIDARGEKNFASFVNLISLKGTLLVQCPSCLCNILFSHSYDYTIDSLWIRNTEDTMVNLLFNILLLMFRFLAPK